MEHAEQKKYPTFNGRPDLFGAPPRQSYAPKPEKIREKLLAMLECVRSAEEWDEEAFGVNEVIFPQMANWLPAGEAARLREEFAAELARLKAS